MCGRIKEWVLLAAIRTFHFAFPGLYAVDTFLVENYERFVADPLQFRGINLAIQLRGWYTVGALLNLFHLPLSLWNLPAFVFWSAIGVFGNFRSLEPRDTEEICRNPEKLYIPAVVLRCSIYWANLLFVVFGGIAGARLEERMLVLVPIMITSACDTKPPRPKRVTRLVPATEGA